MLIEIHMVKNYPPTNLNRDDTGSPKTCTFGGFRRGRISSQCLKRGWRVSALYDSLLPERGIRTRKLPELVATELKKRGMEEDAVNAIAAKVTGIGNKDGTENADGITAQIIFYSPEDITAIANLMQNEFVKAGTVKAFEKLKTKELVKSLQDVDVRPITLDMALFGRMVTSNAFRNVEAAMQVAHAISTHTVNQESDYFTAMDDLVGGNDSEDSGAAMIDDVDFNSSCYYHYASIDMNQLSDNLKDAPNRDELIDKLIPALIQVMAYTNPSGKQNSFAGNVLPAMMMLEIKPDPIPVSYVNAFVKPARAGVGRSLVENSLDKFVEEVNKTDAAFSIPCKRVFFAPGYESCPNNAESVATLSALIDRSNAAVQSLC